MSLLNDKIKDQLLEAFASLTHPVKIVLFTQGNDVPECDYCAETHQLLAEVAALSDQITLDVHDFVAEAGLARQYGIDKIPAAAIVRGGPQEKDHGIRL